MKSPKNVFIFLLFLIVILVAICLPENLHLQFALGPLRVDRVINPLSIDLTRFNIPLKKEFTTHLGLDLSGGTQVMLEADMAKVEPSDRLQALESAKNVIDRRVNFLGVSEPTVQTAVSKDHYRIIVELPGVTDVNRAVQIIGTTAQLEFRELSEQAYATGSATPSSALDITKSTGLTGKDLKRASVVYNTTNGQPEVGISFTPDGTTKFAELTKRLIGKTLAIFLDDELVSAPTVSVEIMDGQAVIQGQFTLEVAKALATQLNAGALPVPVKVVEQRVIEASLGKSAVSKSIRAGFIGLGIVAVYMILQYGVLGLISVAGLVTYGLLTFALFRAIPITLTLPGIAGFILSVGMAVDSNILIFERYKEEKRKGVPWKIAIEQAFGKAWDSIRDANVTTILTCLILFNPMNWEFLPSSGLVRGFAVTLFLGVLLSLFTGLVVTRTFIRVLYKERTK